MRQRLAKLLGASALVAAGLVSLPAATTYNFQEGVNGYDGTVDTQIRFGSPDRDDSARATLSIDGSDGGGENHVLMRFEKLSGTGPGQIPPGSIVIGASLTLHFTDPGSDPDLHRMLVAWAETNTWNQFDPVNLDGVTADDIEAAAILDGTLEAGLPVPVFSSVVLPVTTIQDWLDGRSTNYGWFFKPSGGNGADFVTSEGSVIENRPRLTIITGAAGELWLRSVSPADGETDVTADANIVFIIKDTAAMLNPASIQLFVNGQSVQPTLVDKPAGSDETTITYDPPADLPLLAQIPVRLVYASDSTPPFSSTNDFSFTTRGATVALVLVDDTRFWRYDRSGTDLGTAWREKTYNDSAWPEGLALIASEDPAVPPEPIRTSIDLFSDLGEYVATFYFRTRFTYNGPLGGNLYLRHLIDDGAIFYLNGVEIHRYGYPPGVTVLFNNTAAAGHEATAYDGPFILSGGALVTGENVLAVEVHQSGGSSSDMVFGAELLVATTGLKATTIDSISPAPNSTNVAVSAAIAITLSDGAQQVQTNSIQLSVNGQAVTPVISKPTGSRTTDITYDPPGDLPLGSTVTVRLVFSDSATPPNITTNEFSFSTRAGQLYTFQEGVNGYTNTLDTFITSGNTLADESENVEFEIDEVPGVGGEFSLIRFENIFGSGPGQIPPGSRILSATLTVNLVNRGDDPRLHRMLVPWDELSNWDSMVDGVADDDIESAATPDAIFTGQAPIVVVQLPASTLQAWLDGTRTNYGWIFRPSGDDGVDMASSEALDPSSRPLLSVEVAPQGGPAPRFTSVSRSGANVLIEWTGTGTLESATAVTGPWTTEANAQSPFSAPASGAARFYRLRQ